MENELNQKKKDYLIPISIFLSVFIVAVGWIYRTGVSVTPSLNIGGVGENELPVRWDDLGARLVKAGVIDEEKFLALYASRGTMNPEFKRLLESENNGYIAMNKENAGLWLNLFWALGLSNRNDVLDKGPMMDPRYGGAGRFASTGGWTLAMGDPMNHYSTHNFINLTPEQQGIVEKVAKNIYRPCCDNSTYFPDCNHGMAMLGLLELMASQGAGEATMYQSALVVNSFWFPDTYQNIGMFLSQKGINAESVPPQDVLSAEYSSASGYRTVVAALKPEEDKRASCGI